MSPRSRKRGRQKGRRNHRPRVASGARPRSGWELQHSPYTAEGRIESAYRFAVGAKHQTGWKRRVLIGLGLLFPIGIGFGLLIGIITALARWIS